MSLKHPFIVQMYAKLQSKSKIYFVFEFVPGGELFRLIQERELYISEIRLFSA